MSTRNLINELGGYRAVAARLGKRPTTVHTHMQAGVLPAAWYDALCVMAAEAEVCEPNRGLFSFLAVASENDAKDAAA